MTEINRRNSRRCLKCDKLFKSLDTRRNRICLACNNVNLTLSRVETYGPASLLIKAGRPRQLPHN